MQSSVAVSGDGERWILLNASPDLRQQVATYRALWPSPPRTSPIHAIVLTDGEIDHTAGILLLRESAARLPLYASTAVLGLLSESWPLVPLLAAYAGLEPRALRDGAEIGLADGAGRPLGISCTSLPIARRPPRYVKPQAAGGFEVALR
ncbi:MAG: MBL fold metallo-hydrolase, partial [Gemmatimonadales bacterium]